MSWLLEQISIEGFRGINNAGAPLALKFQTDKVNSVFAPNGVGKSSIFEAVSYALTGGIPKLDSLPAAENSKSYYLNQFHPNGIGTISLTLRPAVGGAATSVTVTRDKSGKRSVTTSDGSDGNKILDALNREFVLLDSQTLHKFIDETPLNRGRSFSTLLGLGSYSTIRQALQGLSNTRSFNSHFDVAAKAGKKTLVTKQITQARAEIRSSYLSLVGKDLEAGHSDETLRDDAHAALCNIPIIRDQCEGKAFESISADDCLVKVRYAEGGEDKERLSKLLQSEASLISAIGALPVNEAVDELIHLAQDLDAALLKTSGDLFLKLYKLTEQITVQDVWHDKRICPACDRGGEGSVLDHVRAKIELYESATKISEKQIQASAKIDWINVAAAESASMREGESPTIRELEKSFSAGGATETEAKSFQTSIAEVRRRLEEQLANVSAERKQLEERLPPSLVAVTEKIEAARRLQAALKQESSCTQILNECMNELDRIERVRLFLSEASTTFSKAEGDASRRRLSAVEPLFRKFFNSIVFGDVVPAISKRGNAEDLQISLASFHQLTNVSAQSLLSESYRNAFAISVYLAAAALYAGSAKFLLLDDITSSLDAGHQFHLMEVIRTQFSRPETPDGPQVILLSHDTLLEKYFNRNASTPGWCHQRIEGTPNTAVFQQSNAVNRVHQATMGLLGAGNAQDAAPRIRQYLEYTLEEVIVRCRIPVPMDIALNDDRKMASHLIGAIEAQVKLHAAANSLVLDPQQITSMNIAVATIASNFLAHWSTGQTQAFSANALLGVMQAIDSYADCFKFEPTPGSPKRFYKSLSQRQ